MEISFVDKQPFSYKITCIADTTFEKKLYALYVSKHARYVQGSIAIDRL